MLHAAVHPPSAIKPDTPSSLFSAPRRFRQAAGMSRGPTCPPEGSSSHQQPEAHDKADAADRNNHEDDSTRHGRGHPDERQRRVRSAASLAADVMSALGLTSKLSPVLRVVEALLPVLASLPWEGMAFWGIWVGCPGLLVANRVVQVCGVGVWVMSSIFSN